MEMIRVFPELTLECECTTQLYAYGYEKKEIANMKCRAESTVNNQIQTAFPIVGVRNGRELAREFYKRLAALGISMDYKPQFRSFLACGILCMFTASVLNYNRYRRPRRLRNIRVERLQNGRYTWQEVD